MRKNPPARPHRIDTDAQHDARTGKRASVVQAQRRLQRLGELGYMFGDDGWYHQSGVWRSNELFGGSGGREKVPRAVAKDLTEYVRSGTYTSNVPRGGALGEVRSNPMPNRSMTSQQRARFAAGAAAARRAYAQWTSHPGTPLPFSPGEDHWYDAGWDATWRRLSNGAGGKHPGYRETRANPRGKTKGGVSAFQLARLGAWVESYAFKQAIGQDPAVDLREAARISDELRAAGATQEQITQEYDAATERGRAAAKRAMPGKTRGYGLDTPESVHAAVARRDAKANPKGYQWYVVEVDDATKAIVRVLTGNEYKEDAQEAKADQPRPPAGHSLRVYSKAKVEREGGIPRGMKGLGRRANPQGSAAFPQGDASHRLTKRLRAKLTEALAVYPEKRNGDHAVMRAALNWPGGFTTKKLLVLNRLVATYAKKGNPRRIAWQPPTAREKKYGVDLVGYDDAGNRYEIESETVRGTKWHEVYLMPHAGSFGGGVREKLTSKGTLALAKDAAEQTAARMAR